MRSENRAKRVEQNVVYVYAGKVVVVIVEPNNIRGSGRLRSYSRTKLSCPGNKHRRPLNPRAMYKRLKHLLLLPAPCLLSIYRDCRPALCYFSNTSPRAMLMSNGSAN